MGIHEKVTHVEFLVLKEKVLVSGSLRPLFCYYVMILNRVSSTSLEWLVVRRNQNELDFVKSKNNLKEPKL